MQSLVRAFQYACAGIAVTLRGERNMRIHVCVMLLTLLVELILRPRLVFSLMVFGVGTLVLALELVNTSIESAIDLSVGTEIHELARIAKDAAAGAVLVAAVGACIIGVGMLVSTYPWHWYLWSNVHAGAAWLNLIGLAVTALLCAYALRVRRA